MADEQRDRDERLPVTAEVGGEGGSFADPTYQESGRKGVRSPGLDRAERGQTPDAAGNALHQEDVAAGGVGTEPSPRDGMKKPVTE